MKMPNEETEKQICHELEDKEMSIGQAMNFYFAVDLPFEYLLPISVTWHYFYPISFEFFFFFFLSCISFLFIQFSMYQPPLPPLDIHTYIYVYMYKYNVNVLYYIVPDKTIKAYCKTAFLTMFDRFVVCCPFCVCLMLIHTCGLEYQYTHTQIKSLRLPLCLIVPPQHIAIACMEISIRYWHIQLRPSSNSPLVTFPDMTLIPLPRDWFQ
ncbi:hypothetical protein RFI_23404, partial [Reticulomyxa filosa]